MDACADGGVVPQLMEKCMAMANFCNADLQVVDRNLGTVIRDRIETLSATFPLTDDTLPLSRVVIVNKSLSSWMDTHLPSLHFTIDFGFAAVKVDVDSWEGLGPAVTNLMELATRLEKTLKDASGPLSSIVAALGDIHAIASSAQSLVAVPVNEDSSPCVEKAMQLCAEAQQLLVGQFHDVTLHITSAPLSIALPSQAKCGQYSLEPRAGNRDDTIRVFVSWHTGNPSVAKTAEVTNAGGNIYDLRKSKVYECLKASLLPGMSEEKCFLVLLCRVLDGRGQRVITYMFKREKYHRV